MSARSVVETEEGRVTVDPWVARPEKCVRTRFSGISCEVCRRGFMPSRAWQRFCSARCRAAARRQLEKDHLSEVLARALPDDPGRAE